MSSVDKYTVSVIVNGSNISVDVASDESVETLKTKAGCSGLSYKAVFGGAQMAPNASVSEYFKDNATPTVGIMKQVSSTAPSQPKPQIDLVFSALNNIPAPQSQQKTATAPGVSTPSNAPASPVKYDHNSYLKSQTGTSVFAKIAQRVPSALSTDAAKLSLPTTHDALPPADLVRAHDALAATGLVDGTLTPPASLGASVTSLSELLMPLAGELESLADPQVCAEYSADQLASLACALHVIGGVQQQLAAAVLELVAAPAGPRSSSAAPQVPQQFQELGAALGQMLGGAAGGGLDGLIGGLLKGLNVPPPAGAPGARKSGQIEELSSSEEEDEEDDLYGDAASEEDFEDAQSHPPASAALELQRSGVGADVRAKFATWTGDASTFSREVISAARVNAPFSETYLAGAPGEGGAAGPLGGSGGQAAANNRLPAPDELFSLRFLRTCSKTKLLAANATVPAKEELSGRYVRCVLEKAAREASVRQDFSAQKERFPFLSRAVALLEKAKEKQPETRA